MWVARRDRLGKIAMDDDVMTIRYCLTPVTVERLYDFQHGRDEEESSARRAVGHVFQPKRKKNRRNGEKLSMEELEKDGIISLSA